MMTQSIVSCVQPLTSLEQKPAPHGQSRTASQASTLVTIGTDAVNEGNTPLQDKSGGQAQESLEEKQQQVLTFIIRCIVHIIFSFACMHASTGPE